MEALALACWGLYLLVGVAVRALVQWRRTGSTGIRGIGGRGVERAAGIAFVAGNVLGAAAPLLGAPDDAWPAGLALFALGFAGLVAAQYAMGASWRIGVDPEERTGLVTGGPFAIVRNPIFSAMFVLQAGLVLIAPNAAAVAAWLIVFVSVQVQVRAVEEPYLFRTHEREYRAYTERVGRFAPGIGRRRSG